ncbi:putative UPF0481 protein At3g02645 [Rhodamnia argentea]|uniref:UPF0481 protein At3g02645 n=1 Tax=Rhodamnia argentea TaxID=178133 RepID=A0A8B8QT19_9MYRT|nr:putative UPF0481 protein At3g02645 [Rhodamnia argentea]
MSSSSTSIINSSLSEEQWVEHIRDALDHGIDIETLVSVHRVPESISSAKLEAYVPHHVALGPYHHFWPQLYQTENPKLAAARRARAVLKLPAFDLIAGLLEEQEGKIRASYQMHLEVGTDTLKWVITIDSLFLLDLLYGYKDKREKMDRDKSASIRSKEDPTGDDDRGGIVPMTRDSIVKDVMMVENQIPTFVLRKIMLQSKNSTNEVSENGEDESIDRELGVMLIRFCKAISPLGLERCSPSEAVRHYKHLLDLLYNLILRRTVPEAVQTKKNELGGARSGHLINKVSVPAPKVTEAWKELSKFSFMKKLRLPIVLIYKLIQSVMQLIPGCSDCLRNNPSHEIVMIPTVSKLHGVGIKVRSAEGGIRTIEFDQKTATLKLPRIVLNPTTEVLLRNLVAYEMISQSSPLILTRYTELMYGIIGTCEDVKLLRGASIVSNHLNCDDKVVELFNGMIKSIGSRSNASELDKTIQDVNRYYNSTRKVKAYNLMRKYVYSSWKFLTMFATVVLILLMGLQTFCSVCSCPQLFNTT